MDSSTVAELPGEGVVLDLQDDVEAVVRLITDKSWRVRVVEQMDLEQTSSCRSRRSLQAAPLGTALAGIIDARRGDAPPPACARVLLPVARIPKHPLLGFDIEVAGSRASLVNRGMTAHLQAEVIASLADQSGHPTGTELKTLFRSICEFTPGAWQRVRGEGIRQLPEAKAIRTYLREGVGLNPTAVELERWSSIAKETGAILGAHLGQGADSFSSAENVLLALPLLGWSEDQWADEAAPAAVDRLLLDFKHFVMACDQIDHAAARTALSWLAEYGRRWEMLVVCQVRLDEPFTAKYAEDRPLKVGVLGAVSHPIVFDDARSNHFAARSMDPDLVLMQLQPKSASGARSDVLFTSRRFTREGVAVYSSEPSRDHVLTIRLRLRPSGDSALVASVLVGISWLAVVLLWVVEPMTDDRVAVLVVPTTLAAALPLAQHRTALAVRAMRPFRAFALCSILALWVSAAVMYLGDHVQKPK